MYTEGKLSSFEDEKLYFGFVPTILFWLSLVFSTKITGISKKSWIGVGLWKLRQHPLAISVYIYTLGIRSEVHEPWCQGGPVSICSRLYLLPCQSLLATKRSDQISQKFFLIFLLAETIYLVVFAQSTFFFNSKVAMSEIWEIEF